ncbi:smyd2a, partial [Symbiodinium natans]
VGEILQSCAAVSKDLVLQARLGLTNRKMWQVMSEPKYVRGQIEQLARVYPWIKFASDRGLLERLNLASIHKWGAMQMHFKQLNYEADDSSESSC